MTRPAANGEHIPLANVAVTVLVSCQLLRAPLLAKDHTRHPNKDYFYDGLAPFGCGFGRAFLA